MHAAQTQTLLSCSGDDEEAASNVEAFLRAILRPDEHGFGAGEWSHWLASVDGAGRGMILFRALVSVLSDMPPELAMSFGLSKNDVKLGPVRLAKKFFENDQGALPEWFAMEQQKGGRRRSRV